MRRFLAVGVAALAVLAMLAPPAFAQAPPASKVTIQGLVDNVFTNSWNMSMNDLSLAKEDRYFRARTRVRPDIIGQLGDAKLVLGMEFDYSYGQTSVNSTQQAGNGTARGSISFGETMGSDINTDTARLLEIKWAYTEVPLTFMPTKTIARFGTQPFDVTYKQSIYANSDFPGVHISTVLNEAAKLNLTYAFISSSFSGRGDGFIRGDAGALMVDPEITPFKGLDIRPLYSYIFIHGISSTAGPRLARGGVGNAFCTPGNGFGPNGAQGGITTPVANGGAIITTGNAGANTAAGPPCFTPGAEENRHTVGLDARWRSGPFSLDPTFMYQWGTRQVVGNVATTAGPAAMGTLVNGVNTLQHEQKMQAWIADIRGGYQTGPLLLQLIGIYTPGNKATEDIRNPRRTANFYQALSTDTSFYYGMAEIWALGIDYLQGIRANAFGLFTGNSIGYDKYGLARLGAAATYALTPTFSVRSNFTANWTAEAVDTVNTIITSNGIVPCAGGATATNVLLGATGCNGQFQKGDSSYLGSELDLGFTYKFAPGVALDVVGGYAWSGPALATAEVTGSAGSDGISLTRANPKSSLRDVQTVTARVRYSF